MKFRTDYAACPVELQGNLLRSDYLVQANKGTDQETFKLLVGELIGLELSREGGLPKVATAAFSFPQDAGQADEVLTTDGAGKTSWQPGAGGGASELSDLTDVAGPLNYSDGQYLRANGTAFTSSVIQDADLPSTFIRSPTGGSIGNIASWLNTNTILDSGINTNVLVTTATPGLGVADRLAEWTGSGNQQQVSSILASRVVQSTTGGANDELARFTTVDRDILGSGIFVNDVVTLNASQTLTNKTMDGQQNTFVNLPLTALGKSPRGSLITYNASDNATLVLPGNTDQVLTMNASGDPEWRDSAGGGLSAVEDDPAPRLGGTLNTNGNNIQFTNATDSIVDNLGSTVTRFERGGGAPNSWITHRNGSSTATMFFDYATAFCLGQFDVKGTLGYQWNFGGVQAMTLTPTGGLDFLQYRAGCDHIRLNGPAQAGSSGQVVLGNQFLSSPGGNWFPGNVPAGWSGTTKGWISLFIGGVEWGFPIARRT